MTLLGDAAWRERTERAGLGFASGLAWEEHNHPLSTDPELFSTAQGGLRCFRRLVEGVLVPLWYDLAASLEREVAAGGYDLIVAHHLAFPVELLHERTGIPYATVCLAPGLYPSASAMPSGFAHAPLPAWTGPLGRAVQRLFWGIGRWQVGRLLDPVADGFRRRAGLPPKANAMWAGWSSRLVLHLYSEALAARPPEWGPQHVVTGFCFNDEAGDEGSGAGKAPASLPPEVEAFLDPRAGPKPWLFTLGTTAIHQPGAFYQAAVAAVAGTGHRAILLTGLEKNRASLPPLPPNVLAIPYLSHAAIFPRCAAVAHQCGIGTLAAGLRAGVPVVACPYAFDQPGNAALLAHTGTALVVPRESRTGPVFRRTFAKLLAGPAPARARLLAATIAKENGALTAALALEKEFGGGRVRGGAAPEAMNTPSGSGR
ncbi:UDP:flavonoid glycosyltransferase YjiC, YdhE family [Verrucomicrobium sp. GAS474]|nr:UDP:flavonoid glycosyltransferase YjiC, YdhE family [Verrucomicrobium sp. GAS474]